MISTVVHVLLYTYMFTFTCRQSYLTWVGWGGEGCGNCPGPRPWAWHVNVYVYINIYYPRLGCIVSHYLTLACISLYDLII